MKIKACELKHGQRFMRGELSCTAAGMVSASGQSLHLVEGAIGWIDKDREVELIEPANDAANCVAVGAGCGHASESSIDPGEGYRLLEYGEIVRDGDEARSFATDWWEVSSPGRTLEQYIDFCPGVVFVRRRIEPTYRPYTETEMLDLLGASVKRKGKTTKHGWLITIVDDGSTVVGHLPVNAKQLLRDYEFLDGGACGVRE